MLKILRTLLILSICVVVLYYLFTFAVDNLNLKGGVSLKVAEPINILGELDASKALDMVKSQIPGLESCWTNERKESGGFAGIIRVEAKINSSGDILAPQCTLLSGESPGNRFQNCVCARVNKWRSPAFAAAGQASILFQVYPIDEQP